MSIHIQKFVDRVRGCELRGSKDVILTITEAKDLHSDITRLLNTLEELRSSKEESTVEEVMQVTIEGGSFN